LDYLEISDMTFQDLDPTSHCEGYNPITGECDGSGEELSKKLTHHKASERIVVVENGDRCRST